jgi:hypothetical protein
MTRRKSQKGTRRSQSVAYARSASDRYVLFRDGTEITHGSEIEIWKYLHRHTSCSVDWALKYEGYRIEPEEIQP